MSLKAFHIVFITCSILLTVFFGIWSLSNYFGEGGPVMLGYTALSVVALAGLIWYGKYFMKKLKHIQYL